MKRINRKPYKTEVVEKPTPNTLLEQLKKDYMEAVKNSNRKMVYKKSWKSQYKMKRRKSINEYIQRKEARDKVIYEAELKAFMEELSKL